MRTLLLLTLITTSFTSCKGQSKVDTLQYQQLCESFLQSIYSNDKAKALSNLDETFIKAAKEKNMDLDNTVKLLSDKFTSDYPGGLKMKMVTQEQTIHEKLPTTFIIAEIENADKFGYCYYYVNNDSKKILLFGEFSSKMQKRK